MRVVRSLVPMAGLLRRRERLLMDRISTKVRRTCRSITRFRLTDWSSCRGNFNSVESFARRVGSTSVDSHLLSRMRMAMGLLMPLITDQDGMRLRVLLL